MRSTRRAPFGAVGCSFAVVVLLFLAVASSGVAPADLRLQTPGGHRLLGAAAEPLGHSPRGQMLVVTTNLQEAWDLKDIADNTDMRRYVARLLSKVPYIPDVLLLQEVRFSSARYVMNRLTRATGDKYGFGWKAPEQPWKQTDARRWEMDNGILINTETVKKLDAGGWIDLTYSRRHAIDKSERIETTRHSRVSVTERQGTLSVAMANVHLQYGHMLAKHDPMYQRTWTDKLATTMKSKYPKAVRVIAGDFNKLNYGPYYDNLRDEPYNYNDSLLTAFINGAGDLHWKGVDRLFTTGGTEDAGSDKDYDKTREATFYSDHQLYWALFSKTAPVISYGQVRPSRP